MMTIFLSTESVSPFWLLRTMRKNMHGMNDHLTKRGVQSIVVWLFSQNALVVRFICTGGIAGVLQLALLNVLSKQGWNSIFSNLVAFLLSAQVNFLLSSLFTWRDRQPEAKTRWGFWQYWLSFHGSIICTALLNQSVFIIIHSFLPPLVASALGIGSAALANFLLMNHFVFRSTTHNAFPGEKSGEHFREKRGDSLLPLHNSPVEAKVRKEYRMATQEGTQDMAILQSALSPAPIYSIVAPVFNEEETPPP